jgi:hypothetical protein
MSGKHERDEAPLADWERALLDVDDVRDVIASLRAGDEVEVVYRGRVSRVEVPDLALGDDDHWCLSPHAVRVIKRCPLPEPPVGSVVEWASGERWHRFTDGWFAERVELGLNLSDWGRVSAEVHEVLYTPEATR